MPGSNLSSHTYQLLSGLCSLHFISLSVKWGQRVSTSIVMLPRLNKLTPVKGIWKELGIQQGVNKCYYFHSSHVYEYKVCVCVCKL